ncbi:hypothetical protein MLD38_017077 [Melastoma candidum]|uniref:Uncharacterized protein n=1 Tax=Melastoma candidum TaxID=119954 RepID=A0ACB9QPJ3_9MYRT|nr:hypothetical protein MLD38_017077 [Melastoma candidum]
MFRLKSLKQGQSRSLLTQAARHHAAQLSFFKKALKSLEGVEPHVEYVTEQQHIDYPFDGLEDEDDDEMDDDSYDTNDDGELSFDYARVILKVLLPQFNNQWSWIRRLLRFLQLTRPNPQK